MLKNKLFFEEYYLKKSKLIKSWYNNCINSRNCIVVPYFNKQLLKKRFYPNFIVNFKNGSIWIFDSEIWFFSKESIFKARWLENYIKKQNNKKIIYIWGIIEQESTYWVNKIVFLINNKVDFDWKNKNDFNLFSDEYVLMKLLDEKLKFYNKK